MKLYSKFLSTDEVSRNYGVLFLGSDTLRSTPYRLPFVP